MYCFHSNFKFAPSVVLRIPAGITQWQKRTKSCTKDHITDSSVPEAEEGIVGADITGPISKIHILLRDVVVIKEDHDITRRERKGNWALCDMTHRARIRRRGGAVAIQKRGQVVIKGREPRLTIVVVAETTKEKSVIARAPVKSVVLLLNIVVVVVFPSKVAVVLVAEVLVVVQVRHHKKLPSAKSVRHRSMEWWRWLFLIARKDTSYAWNAARNQRNVSSKRVPSWWWISMIRTRST